eukprot:scaffold8120_cov73-Cylindrotheca_fusiformis.AAC.5
MMFYGASVFNQSLCGCRNKPQNDCASGLAKEKVRIGIRIEILSNLIRIDWLVMPYLSSPQLAIRSSIRSGHSYSSAVSQSNP